MRQSKKAFGISKFDKTENENNLNIPTWLKSMNNPLSRSRAAKGTVMYKQIDTRMDTLLHNYKVQATKIIFEVTKFEVEQNKKKVIYAMDDSISIIAHTLTIVKLDMKK